MVNNSMEVRKIEHQHKGKFWSTTELKQISSDIIQVLMILIVLCPLRVKAQEYNGTSGLLNVPSAEIEAEGTFRGGAAFLHREFLPDKYPGTHHPFGYYASISPLSWIEVSYAATFLRYRKSGRMVTNEDRHSNVKIRPLKEGTWWPAIAVGMDDIGTRWGDELDKNGNKNNHFQNIYVVGSKHLNISGYEWGAHLAYRYYTSTANKNRRGIAGGLTLRPAFYKPLRCIVEWDGVGVNAGADVLLWRHLFLQASLVHGTGFMGCVSYHYTIPF